MFILDYGIAFYPKTLLVLVVECIVFCIYFDLVVFGLNCGGYQNGHKGEPQCLGIKPLHHLCPRFHWDLNLRTISPYRASAISCLNSESSSILATLYPRSTAIRTWASASSRPPASSATSAA